MSRLTKEQAIKHYGLNLPTPIIEKITLSSVKDSDEIYESMDTRTAVDAYAAAHEEMNIEDARASAVDYNKLVRVTVNLSFRFTTWEGFDVSDITKELFQTFMADGESNESLYVSILISKQGLPPTTSISKTGICQSLQTLGSEGLSFVQNQPAGSKDYYWASTAITAAGGPSDYIVSVPLAEFFEVAEMSAEYDADNNAIVVVSNIEVTTYIRDFKEIDNLVYFCGTSTAHPYDLSNYIKLDPLSRSLNYSEFAYERVLKNGSLETFSDPIFVDQSGNQYPEMPLAALNKKYYKVDNFGKTQIISAVSALLNEYARFRNSDAELTDVTDQVIFVRDTYREDNDLLLLLNKAAQTFSITNEDSRAVRFSERLRIVINNADTLLRNQQEVVKRIVRNYVVVDLREITHPTLSESSYVSGLTDEDFLYTDFLHTNIANYVPMNAQGSAYPGTSELPFSPSELIDQYNDKQNGLRQRISNLLLPNDADLSPQALVESNAEVGTISNALTRLNRATEAMTDWLYNDWSARMIKGSADEAYRKSNNHDGVHYYICRPHEGSLFRAPGENTITNYTKWNWGGILSGYLELYNPETIVGDIDLPGGLLSRSPRYFHDMVYDTKPQSGTPYWKAGSYKWGIYRSATDELYNMPGQGTVSEFSYNPQDTVDVFGYLPSWQGDDQTQFHLEVGSTSRDLERVSSNMFEEMSSMSLAERARPDGVNSWDHASSYCLPATWAYRNGDSFSRLYNGDDLIRTNIGYSIYMDEFFWTSDYWVRVNSIWKLAQEPYQVSFYVPKRKSPDTGSPELVTVDESLLPADWSETDEGWDSYAEEEQSYEDAIEYRDRYFDWIGGISPLYQNSSRLGVADSLGAPAEGDVNWWRCARKKYATLYKEVQDLIYTTYGIDEYTLTGEAGGLTPEDRGSTNPNTKLDTYLQEAPGLIGEEVLNDLFTALDAMTVNAMDTEEERKNLASAFTAGLYANFRGECEKYFDNGLCKIYAATVARRPSNVAYYWTVEPPPGSAFPPPPNAGQVCQIKYAHLPYETGYDTRPALPYGYWNLPVGVDNRVGDNTFNYNFGKDIIDAMRTIAEGNRDEIQNEIERYLEAKAIFNGASSDTGIHSALAEVDIVLKKYGYFFFDLEKYVRKNSIISRVINVDRMLAYFPRAKQMINSAIQFDTAEVKLHNFNSDLGVANYEVPFFGEMVGQSTFASLKLEKDLDSDTARSTPTDFSKMTFYSPVDGATDQPVAYNKINALQGIDFSQITEFTSGSTAAFAGLEGSEVTDGSEDAGDGDIFDGSYGTLPGAQLEFGGASAAPDFGTPEADRLGTSQAAAAAQLSAQAAAARVNEVDVDALLESQYAPRDIYSSLILRNYAFPGFSNQALFGTRWRQDYRLMMFRYQFFTDDDKAYIYTPREDIIESESNLSYDDIEVEIRIKDKSDKTVEALVDFFSRKFEIFKEEYVAYAEEACAFDSFNQVFNKFFAGSMKNKFPDPPRTPWHEMSALYTTYQNIFTDTFGGDQAEIQEKANSILEKIRPETGNLLSLRDFTNACELMKESLIGIKDDLAFARQETDLDSRSNRTFTIRQTIGNPVVDHIGDYTEREEEPFYDGLF